MPRLNKYAVFLFFLGFFLMIVNGKVAYAENEPYFIDQAPLNPPEFSDYTVEDVSDLKNLTEGLTNKNVTKVIYRLQANIEMTSAITMEKDKAIDLNGYTLSGSNSGYLWAAQNTTMTQFKVYNGNLSGGPEKKSCGWWSWPGYSLIHFDYRAIVEVVFEDVNYESSDKGGNFFIGLSCDFFSLGTVNVRTYATNVRAGNMTFLGDFNGEAFGRGSQKGFYGEGDGALNLSFEGKERGTKNPFNKFGNSNAEAMSQTVGDRRLYIGPDSHVVLKNLNDGCFDNTNNIMNFSTLTVDGSLEASSFGPPLATNAASVNNGQKYLNQAGTYNGQSNININEGAVFNISSSSKAGKYGLFFGYSCDINIYKPKSLEMNYAGKLAFFYVYERKPRSNLHLYDLDIGVWDRGGDVTGNPNAYWADIETYSAENFTLDDVSPNYAGDIYSSNQDMAENFDTAKYTRISNDIVILKTSVDNDFIDSDNRVFLNNGSDSFSGSTSYVTADEVVRKKLLLEQR